MRNEITTKREILSAKEVPVEELAYPVREFVLTMLADADWGRPPSLSITEVVGFVEGEPRFFVDSWAPASVIPAGVLAESEEDEVLEWVTNHRGISSPAVMESVCVLPADDQDLDALRIQQGGPVIVVWRIAYDQRARPFLAQREILHPSHLLTYARWFPYEKSLPRRGSPGGRRGAAA